MRSDGTDADRSADAARARMRHPGRVVTVQQEQHQARACAHCDFEDPHLHPVRLQRRTGEVVESLVCRFCFMQLTGLTPGTARRTTRPER
jgi:hypothetical protein